MADDPSAHRVRLRVSLRRKARHEPVNRSVGERYDAVPIVAEATTSRSVNYSETEGCDGEPTNCPETTAPGRALPVRHAARPRKRERGYRHRSLAAWRGRELPGIAPDRRRHLPAVRQCRNADAGFQDLGLGVGGTTPEAPRPEPEADPRQRHGRATALGVIRRSRPGDRLRHLHGSPAITLKRLPLGR
jgi:hypothetical protein